MSHITRVVSPTITFYSRVTQHYHQPLFSCRASLVSFYSLVVSPTITIYCHVALFCVVSLTITVYTCRFPSCHHIISRRTSPFILMLRISCVVSFSTTVYSRATHYMCAVLRTFTVIRRTLHQCFVIKMATSHFR